MCMDMVGTRFVGKGNGVTLAVEAFWYGALVRARYIYAWAIGGNMERRVEASVVWYILVYLYMSSRVNKQAGEIVY